MNKGISVIICTYNGAQRLPKTIEHIARQEVDPQIKWEVIIINNNSTDNTKEIAQEEWDKYNLNVPFRVIDEPRQGLSYARQRGIKEALYEYLLFCDDDNWLSKNYVNKAYEIMENHPEVGAAGGQSEAITDGQFPQWFEKYKSSYAVGKQGKKTGIITHRGLLWGAGLIIRKSLLEEAERLDFKSFLTGRKGNELLAGDDSEMCKWIILLGYELWYDEDLKFIHYIASHRLTLDYLKKIHEGFRKSAEYLQKYDTLITVKSLERSKLLNFIIGLKHLLLGNKKVSKTYIQFLIGPWIKVSTDEDLRFIKNYYKIL